MVGSDYAKATTTYSLEGIFRCIEEAQRISEVLFTDPECPGAYPQDMPQQAVDASGELDVAFSDVMRKLRTVKWAVKKYGVKLNDR